MGNNRIRKNSTIVIVITMLLFMTFFTSAQGVAYANAASIDKVYSYNISEKELLKLDDEMFDSDVTERTINFFGELSGGNVEVSKISPKQIELDVSVSNKNAEVVVEQANDQLVEFRVLEDGKEDLIAFNDRGEIFSEGQKIIVDEVIEYGADNKIEVFANAQMRVASCPYGSASSYTYDANKTITKSSTLPKQIVKYTITGLATIIAAALTMNVGASLLVNYASSLIADEAVNKMKTWKTVGKVYYHKDKKKFMVESAIGCQKENTTFYGKKENGSWKVKMTKNIWLYSQVNGA